MLAFLLLRVRFRKAVLLPSYSTGRQSPAWRTTFLWRTLILPARRSSVEPWKAWSLWPFCNVANTWPAAFANTCRDAIWTPCGLIESLTPPLRRTGEFGLGVFFYLPHVCFVAAYGLDPEQNGGRDPFTTS